MVDVDGQQGRAVYHLNRRYDDSARECAARPLHRDAQPWEQSPGVDEHAEREQNQQVDDEKGPARALFGSGHLNLR